VEKFCRGGQATDDNMAHAHSMPDLIQDIPMSN